MTDTSTEAARQLGAALARRVMLSGSQDTIAKAADETLRALAAERDALREALQQMVYETTHLSPEEDDGSHWCRISKQALTQGRAALEAKP